MPGSAAAIALHKALVSPHLEISGLQFIRSGICRPDNFGPGDASKLLVVVRNILLGDTPTCSL